MKAIQPVSIWANGVNSQATQLSLRSIADNLDNSATFYYQLLGVNPTPVMGIVQADFIQLGEGNITIDGEQYLTWGDSSNINDDAYVICAAKLNLILI